MQIFGAHAAFPHKFAEIFAHALGERGNEHAFAALYGERRFVNRVLDLSFNRAHFHHGIEQARRANNLLGDDCGVLEFERRRRCGNKHGLLHERLKFLRTQRAIFHRARQPKTEFHKARLAGTVAVGHSVNLRERDVRFVDEDEKIFRKKINETPRSLFRRAPAEVHGIIFDAEAKTRFAQHFEIVFRAHANALRFEQFSLALKFRDLRFELGADFHDCRFDAILRRNVLIRRIQIEFFQTRSRASRQRIEPANGFDFIIEKRNANCRFAVGGKNVDRIAAHAKRAALEFDIAAAVKRTHEALEQRIAARLHPDFERDHHFVKIIRRARTVNARNGRNHDDVAAGKQRARRGNAQAFEIVVHGGVFFDVSIRRGNVGFGLIIVVVADEIFDGVFGEKMFELGVKLCGERFVVRNDERRTLQSRDDVCHRERFPRAGNAEQRLPTISRAHAALEQINRLRLIARRRKFRDELKRLAAAFVFHGFRRSRGAAFQDSVRAKTDAAG